MSERQDALEAIRDILGTAVNAEANAEQLQGSWVYASQYEDVDAKHLPILIVDQVNGDSNERGMWNHGLSFDRWRAIVILFLHYGEPPHPSKEHAHAQNTGDGWVKAFSAKLADNLTLNDTVNKIGVPDGGTLKYFDYASDYLQWDAEPYWGIWFEIQIEQHINEAMSV